MYSALFQVLFFTRSNQVSFYDENSIRKAAHRRPHSRSPDFTYTTSRTGPPIRGAEQYFHPPLHRAPCHARFDRCLRRPHGCATASARQTDELRPRRSSSHVTADATDPREDMGYAIDLRLRHELSAYAIRPRGTRTRGTFGQRWCPSCRPPRAGA